MNETIAAETDKKTLREWRRAIDERLRALETEEWNARVDAKWESLKFLAPGGTVYCCAEGTFFGGSSIQRGDKLQVIDRNDKSRMIGLGIKIKRRLHWWWFDARELTRYDIRTEKPANPIDPMNRKMVENLNKRLAELPAIG